MRKHLKFLLTSVVFFASVLMAQSSAPLSLIFSELPPVPPNPTKWSEAIPVGETYWYQIGLAGPLAGAHGDYLLVGGGANFPEAALTATRANTLGKVYWDDLFVMRRSASGFEWLPTAFRLPKSIAYSAVISTPKGALVVGGEGFSSGPNGNAKARLEIFSEVFYMRYNPSRNAIEYEALPNLPKPLTYTVAGIAENTLYASQGRDAFSLNLNNPQEGWKTLPPLPVGRDVAVGTAVGGKFYVISGRAKVGDEWNFYKDAYAYDPKAGTWQKIADLPWCVTAGVAFPLRDRYILVVSGDKDIARWNTIQNLVAQRDKQDRGSVAWQKLNDAISWIYDHHTGFNTEILLYDTQSNRWQVAGQFPGTPPVTTPGVIWGNDLLTVTGEARPGVRTPKVWRISLEWR